MENFIRKHTLYIDQNNEEFVQKFCSTSGQNFPKGKLANYLSTWYEGYLYCLLIGLNTNSRDYNGYTKRVEKARDWNDRTLKQYKYCIAKVMAKPDIINELGLAERAKINETFKDMEDLLLRVKDICDEFSLGGVNYLRKKFEDQPDIFDDPLALKQIYEGTL